MAIAMRTLTGRVRDLIRVPYREGRVELVVESSKAVIVDGDTDDLLLGRSTKLLLNGAAGTFTVDLPDSTQAGVLYSLVGSWIDGNGRQAASRKLGTFELTDNANIADIIQTEDGDLPVSIAASLGARLTAAEGRLIPAGGELMQALVRTGAGDHQVGWVTISTGGGSGWEVKGTLPDVGDLPDDAEPGDGWVIGDRIHIWTEADGWINAPFPGPPGPAGLGLPDATGQDGKTVVADDGEWVVVDLPAAVDTNRLVPLPTANGKIAGVVSGAWALIDPPDSGGVSSWDDLEDKPTFIAAGTTPAIARDAIGAASSTQGDRADTAVQIVTWTGTEWPPRPETSAVVLWVGGPPTRPAAAVTGDIHWPDA